MTSAIDPAEYVPSKIKSTDPLHEQRRLTSAERAVFRARSKEARRRREDAIAGRGDEAIHEINVPSYNPLSSMPELDKLDHGMISLFSGGGGLDLGFDRAGFRHAGSWEIMDEAAQTLRNSRPNWTIFGGSEGDVRTVDWNRYRGNISVVHGGPPCQPFSNAGKQRGADDPRDMWPEFVRAVLGIQPEIFVAENVAALASRRFSDYVDANILKPLGKAYSIFPILLQAYEFGVPQVRKRVFFLGFRSAALAGNWVAPKPKFRRANDGVASELPAAPGVRAALGLPDIGFDDVAPTIRSALSGPRHTTSILSSTSAAARFQALQIWPNGVAASREAARAFVAANGHFRLSVADVKLMQGFPEDWAFSGAVYMQLGQIGNSVAPPVAYAVASSIADALRK